MEFEFKEVRFYNPYMAPFDEKGKITERVETGLENVLAAYSYIAPIHASKTDNNPRNYLISQVYIVGSGAHNEAESDLDFMLLTPNLDSASAINFTLFLQLLFFSNRSKTQAIDPYVRKEDMFPGRERIEITDQVKELLSKYNDKIVKTETRRFPRRGPK